MIKLDLIVSLLLFVLSALLLGVTKHSPQHFVSGGSVLLGTLIAYSGYRLTTWDR